MKNLVISYACINWSPGAAGPSKYKNQRSEVALLCFNVFEESRRCWIYDDFKKKMRKFRAKTNHSHQWGSIGYYQGEGFMISIDIAT